MGVPRLRAGTALVVLRTRAGIRLSVHPRIGRLRTARCESQRGAVDSRCAAAETRECMGLKRGSSEHALCLSTSMMMMGRFAAVCLGLVLAGCPTSVDPGI